MPENEIDILQNSLVKSRQLLREKTITSSLLRIITEPLGGIDHALRSLNELYHTDTSYLCFFAEGSIVNIYFQSTDPNRHFAPPADLHLPATLPRQPVFMAESAKSWLGQLDFPASFSYPLVIENRLLGLIQLGGDPSTLNAANFDRFTSTLVKLENAFLLVYDREIKTKQLHSVRSELIHSQSRLEVLFSDSKDLIATINSAGSLIEINPAGSALLGYAHSETPEALPLISPTMDFIGSLLRKTNLISDLEIVLEAANGKPIFGLASFSAVDDRQSEIYCIVKNITELVKTQQALQTANLSLNKANETLVNQQSQMVQQEKLASIGELAAGVAHEINNPLAFVFNNFQVLGKYFHKLLAYQQALEQLGANQANAVQALKKQYKVEHLLDDANAILQESADGFQRIIAIIKSLKDFSRVDSAGTKTIIDLNEALGTTINIARNSWKYVATVETDFQLHEPVECCASELNQVFLNLIVNAAQAIEEQKRSSPGLIKISTALQGNQAEIRICDNGPGIPPQTVLRIFDPFFTTKPIGKGTGLGLSISYDIVVNKHGGDLSVESQVGSGSCFRILLPTKSPPTSEVQ